jgi:ubiquinone/menaquinone biosynthesis C-methylase UbiE
MRRTILARALCCLAILCWVSTAACSEASRDRELQPDRVIREVGVQPGMTLGEIGAGRGYFTVKLARAVGPTGRVLANDIDSGALASLERRCQREELHNVETVLGEYEDPLLPDQALDMVFMVYSFHDIDDQVALLENLAPSLRPGATVVVLDEDPEITGDNHFLATGTIVDLFREAGYERVPLDDFLERNVLLVFRLAADSAYQVATRRAIPSREVGSVITEKRNRCCMSS